jgi:hypothetical protein
MYPRNWFQAVSCNCGMLHDTDCLRPVPLTFAPPVCLVLLNRFTTQSPSPDPDYCLSKRSLTRITCWSIFLFSSEYRVQFMMMEAEKISETSDLHLEVMSGERWRSPGKIIQCCTIIARNLMK